MGQSLIRYSAVACLVAGGLFLGGAGSVASADTPNDGTGGIDPTAADGNTQTPQPTTSSRGIRIPKWARFPSFGTSPDQPPRIGFIAPPQMNLRATAQPAKGPDGSSPTRQDSARTVVPSFLIDSPTMPAGRQPVADAVVPDTPPPSVGDVTSAGQVDGASPQQDDGTPTGQDQKLAATATAEPPTINLVPLFPRGVMGPPVTIENPLRQLLTPDIDLNQPIMQQLLPTPLVALLNAVSQQIPLAGLVISPVMQFADVVISMLLSDVVVPMPPLVSTSPAPIPTTQLSLPALISTAKLPVGKPGSMLLARNDSPPAELALMGMDVFQASVSSQPLPVSVGGEEPQAPNAPAPDQDAAPLNDPVAYRAGYSDYLRNAGLAQITAIAVPGAVAILFFSMGGGFIGYRQARAGHVIRAEGITRFLR